MSSNRSRLSWLLLCCLSFCLTGCVSSGGMTSWLPWKRGHNDTAIQEYVASQQKAAKQVNTGKESSIYPPEVMQQEPLPKTEKDLKQPMQLHLSYAKLQEQLGHLTEARSSYEKVISREPKSVEAIIGLGRLDSLAGRHEQAEQRFRHAVEVSHNSPEALYTLGQYMASQKRYTEAIVELQKAVRAMPKNQQYVYELGLTLARTEQYAEACQLLTTVSTEAEACYNVGYIALQELQREQIGEQYLNRALQLDPELQQARMLLTQQKAKKAGVQMVSGQTDPARERVIQAVGSQDSRLPRRGEVISADAHSEQASPAEPAGLLIPEGLSPEQLEQWKNQADTQ